MERFILRIFNIPDYKSKEDLELEFKLKGDYKVFVLGARLNSSYGLIEFNSQEELNNFARQFNILRKNVIIY
jgi:D-alanine-D-alanine ligase-like ATP-grasp enzyme